MHHDVTFLYQHCCHVSATGNALSGIMSQYAMDSPSDDNSDEDEEIQSNGPPAQETHKGSVNRVCDIKYMFPLTLPNSYIFIA